MVEVATNSQAPAMLGMGGVDIFGDPEQPVRIAAKASNRIGAVTLMNGKILFGEKYNGTHLPASISGLGERKRRIMTFGEGSICEWSVKV